MTRKMEPVTSPVFYSPAEPTTYVRSMLNGGEQYMLGTIQGILYDHLTAFLLRENVEHAPDLVHRMLVQLFMMGINTMGIRLALNYFGRTQDDNNNMYSIPYVIGLTQTQPGLAKNATKIVTSIQAIIFGWLNPYVGDVIQKVEDELL